MASSKSKSGTAVRDSKESVEVAEQNTATYLPTSTQKSKGKFKDAVGTISTVLPIAGAIGTVAVWLAANFYVAEIQIVPDRAFNTLEVRVSDKKGQESVFHSPHFQLMPGKYHLEVTVDSQFKQHVDVKAVFHHNATIAIHVPAASSAPGAVGAITTTSDGMSLLNPPVAATNTEVTRKAQSESQVVTDTRTVKPAVEESADGSSTEDGSPAKKHWWQFWKKSQI